MLVRLGHDSFYVERVASGKNATIVILLRTVLQKGLVLGLSKFLERATKV